MQVDLLSSAQSAHALHLFHQHSPLVHCMTNDVVQTFTANTLLALGASPAMVIETEEASQFAAIASALLINVGTLTQPRAQAMSAAVEQATRSQTPWTHVRNTPNARRRTGEHDEKATVREGRGQPLKPILLCSGCTGPT